MSKRRFYCDEAAHQAYSEAQDLIAERVGFDR